MYSSSLLYARCTSWRRAQYITAKQQMMRGTVFALCLAGVHGQCEPDCGAKGRCIPGWTNYYCQCDDGFGPGWSGYGLNQGNQGCCAVECNSLGHGRCGEPDSKTDVSQCTCEDDYTGDKCDIAPSAGDPCDTIECKPNGKCHDGQCTCDEGWEGATCNKNECDNIKCGKHGACEKGKCVCADDWSGAKCDKAPANPNSCRKVHCGKNGSCDNGACKCKPGWEGKHCDIDACTGVDCGLGHGQCSKGICVCNPGYSGTFCRNGPCTGQTCNEHGTCVIGGDDKAACTCDAGFYAPSWQPTSCTPCAANTYKSY